MAKRLMYKERMYDYETKAEAYDHIQEMKKKGWQVKDQYEQNDGKYTWTVEYWK